MEGVGRLVNGWRAGWRPVVASSVVGCWDDDVDVVVVGSGASGLVAAVMAAAGGARVVVLEKAAQTGGTTRKSAANAWVPGNRHMRALGLAESRDGALRYMARAARPHLYSPDAPCLGLPEWEYEGICLFVDEGGRAFADLEDKGVFATLPLAGIPNFYSELEEDVHKVGRTLALRAADGGYGDGEEMIRQLSEALVARGGRIELEHRVVSVVMEGERVIGVVAETPAGPRFVRGGQAVIFGSGGFTHNVDLRRSYIRGPVFGGCAANSNEGDFVAIAQAVGADMCNMAESWNSVIQLERALAGDPALRGTFNLVGDSVLSVNRYGRRVMNEKTPYNEATRAMLQFDASRCEYPNMLLFVIWDEPNYATYRGIQFGGGGLMPAADADDSHVIAADTLAQLAERIDERLAAIAHATGGLRLAPDFVAQLNATIDRFNDLARKGHDDDFGRGDSAIERYLYHLAANAARMGTDSGNEAAAGLTTPPPPPDDTTNPTMAPLADHGPYYSVILAAGMLDTKGGPRTDRHGRVLTTNGTPIPGLYAVGNCAASPSGQAYWGGGGTLGAMITYAWLAGQHATTTSAQPLSTVVRESADPAW